ncbi:hypothetical protein [Stenotrophomonas sp. 24(2023)]|uniref:hypothetical protein n=1 Tax=Stenotrophomonas sp. 24(2023) TaxID=3068324 RepID=UPI0027E1C101|nr:hypothetical protein [Stenotrophomonas sp. 24(2023)]WMJ69237.1 hypothetical protein Q9R17_19005 [Stenotrophomonas sp. 24(2023)]
MNSRMMRVALLLCALFACAAASAQVQVGYCDDGVANQRYPLFEFTNVAPNGYFFKTAGLQVYQNGRNKPPTLVPAAPDPSGMHLLAVQSGIAGLQFWIARNGDFITIGQNGWVNRIGGCAFSADFANQFPRPMPTPPTQFVGYAMGFEGSVLAGDVPGLNPAPSMIAPGALPSHLFGEGVHISSPVLVKEAALPTCLAGAGGNGAAFYDCVLKQSLGSREQKIYACSQTSLTRNETALCLLAANMGGQEQADLQRVRQCYAKHQTNWNAYPLCLAEGRVDPKIMSLVQCARQNLQTGQQPSYWNLGACAFGPMLWQQLNPNAEATIAIECAMQTGGNPKAFALCTGGRLLISELDKCLTQGVGNNGCFGKNNTISQAYQKIDDELARALGKSNPAYTAWRAARLASDPAMMARAAVDVNREIGRLSSNLSAEAGRALDNFGATAADLIPRVKVGTPRGKIFGKKWSL